MEKRDSMTPFAQKLITSQRTQARFPYLIKIDHDDYETNPDFPLCFANAQNDMTYNGEIYKAASFSIDPPDMDGAKIGNASLTISAVDQFWIQKIRINQKPASLQFAAAIIYNNKEIIGIEPLEQNNFTLRAVSFDELSISWEMSFDERQAIIITSAECTMQIASGCSS